MSCCVTRNFELKCENSVSLIISVNMSILSSADCCLESDFSFNIFCWSQYNNQVYECSLKVCFSQFFVFPADKIQISNELSQKAS